VTHEKQKDPEEQKRSTKRETTAPTALTRAPPARAPPACAPPACAQSATFWEGVIDEKRLEVGNDGRPTDHWTRVDQEGESVIDLTLAN